MSRDNVGALIDADKAVHEEMRQRYPDGPYQDGMYGTGMLLELGRLGFVVVPTSDWQRLLADTPSVEPPITPEDFDRFTDEQFTAFMHASGFDARIDAALAEAHAGKMPLYGRPSVEPTPETTE